MNQVPCQGTSKKFRCLVFVHSWHIDQQLYSSCSKDLILQISAAILYDCDIGFTLMGMLCCEEMH
jgi:hypothetical protein